MLQGAEPYFWPGTRGKGVLLVHGFTGSPSELRELGEILHRKGYTVEGLLLKGHGTDPRDLLEVKAEQWEEQVRQGVAHLKETCAQVTVIGLSMGGLLALYAGAATSADKLVVISTPSICTTGGCTSCGWRTGCPTGPFPSVPGPSTLRPGTMWPTGACPSKGSISWCGCFRR